MALAALIALAAGSAGCRRDGNSRVSDMEETPLVSVGDSTLMLRDVVSRIPAGLSEADSSALFHTVVEGWLERMLISDVAAENTDDMEEIDRRVEEYRRKLIVANYRRKLREANRDEVPESEVRRYYEEQKEEMVLERPVVKGLYVKIPADASRLADVRRWMMTATPDAIDNLEQYGLTDAVAYSFFDNTWTDFSIMAREIPYRFGDMDAFVASNVNFETTYRGMTYLLHITDHLPSGTPMPYEVAAPRISEQLERDRGERYERRLLQELYTRARREGHLRYHSYSPAPGQPK